MPEIIALAKNVKKIRTEMKLSQLKFAMECDISLDILNQIERERTNPRLSTLQKICAYVGCSVAELLRVDEPTDEKLSYRDELTVTHAIVAENGYSFAICPRCNNSFEREYQAFCDRCGQKLGWKNYKKATKILRSKKDRL